MRAPRNIGGLVTITPALRPVNRAAATSYSLSGIVINRLKYQSGLFIVSAGVDEGTPDSFALDAKLQECDTSGGTYTDVATSIANPAVAITQITTEATERWLEIDFSGLKEFVKLQFQLTFVGGSSPKLAIGAMAVLGGGPVVPTSHA